tara:strand:+ start:220 stop:936 length:717 start_codon:yes stop_codon:yes gene_type:complete
MNNVNNFINGELVANSSNFQNIYDPSTGEVIGKVILSNEKDINLSIESSLLAQKEWANITPLKRSRILSSYKNILENNIDNLAKIVCIEHGKTFEDARRFNITIQEGVNFVLDSLKMMHGGEIFIPKIPSYKITDIAKVLNPKSKIKIIGIRPGEKLHEEMISSSDSLNTFDFGKFYIILPNSEFDEYNLRNFCKLNKIKKWKKCEEGFYYSSYNNEKFLSKLEISRLINSNIKDFEI